MGVIVGLSVGAKEGDTVGDGVVGWKVGGITVGKCVVGDSVGKLPQFPQMGSQT